MFDHAIDQCAEGEHCSMCRAAATHKVGEEIPLEYGEHSQLYSISIARHNFTAYICCECFGRLFGPLAKRWCRKETEDD